jgi:hypothetical protein
VIGKGQREIHRIYSLATGAADLFGGPDGRNVYVTEVEHTRLVTFRVDRPGLAWQRFHEANRSPPDTSSVSAHRCVVQQARSDGSISTDRRGRSPRIPALTHQRVPKS